jgi:hypothetical protein
MKIESKTTKTSRFVVKLTGTQIIEALQSLENNIPTDAEVSIRVPPGDWSMLPFLINEDNPIRIIWTTSEESSTP